MTLSKVYKVRNSVLQFWPGQWHFIGQMQSCQLQSQPGLPWFSERKVRDLSTVSKGHYAHFTHLCHMLWFKVFFSGISKSDLAFVYSQCFFCTHRNTASKIKFIFIFIFLLQSILPLFLIFWIVLTLARILFFAPCVFYWYPMPRLTSVLLDGNTCT